MQKLCICSASKAHVTLQLCRKVVSGQQGACLPCYMHLQVYMSAKAWGDVHYSRVPSVCMRNNKDKFEKHDKERFQQYLDDVKAGKKKIASGALKPHELVREAMCLTR